MWWNDIDYRIYNGQGRLSDCYVIYSGGAHPHAYFMEIFRKAQGANLTLNRIPQTHPKPPKPTQSPKNFQLAISPPLVLYSNKSEKFMSTHLPAETLKISPEALEIANCYLQVQDARQVANELDLDPELVTTTLARREVRNYIDHVFFDTGYNNRFLMRRAMDALIKQKFMEME